MALTPYPSTFTSPFNSSDQSSYPSPSLHFLLPGSACPSPFSLHLSAPNRTPIYFEALKVSSRSKCLAKSPTTAEDFVGDYESLNASDGDGSNSDSGSSDGEGGARDDAKKIDSSSFSSDSTSLGIREPVYEVVEVKATGAISTRKIYRRQLLKSSGLRPRDIRSVDPSLFMTNSVPSLLVRENAILLNLGSLRAIAMRDRVLIFDYNR